MSDDARSRFVHRYSDANSGEIDAELPTRRHGDADQADWEMLFLSRLTVLLSTRPFDAREYEISELTWSDSYLRLVAEV